MKALIELLFLSVILFSCSKEEEIPFIGSLDDTIHVVSYNKIEGVYKGQISIIEWVDFGGYVPLTQSLHAIVVKELSFGKIFIEDISNYAESNAEVELYRLDESRGYLDFLPYSMADSVGADSAYYSPYFNNYFNGEFDLNHDSLMYFIYYLDGLDTIHQVFKGGLQH